MIFWLTFDIIIYSTVLECCAWICTASNQYDLWLKISSLSRKINYRFVRRSDKYMWLIWGRCVVEKTFTSESLTLSGPWYKGCTTYLFNRENVCFTHKCYIFLYLEVIGCLEWRVTHISFWRSIYSSHIFAFRSLIVQWRHSLSFFLWHMILRECPRIFLLSTIFECTGVFKKTWKIFDFV